jgi:3-methyladenine DNA glycosylase/8-oxoguanine DNA glycosylase
LRTELLSSGRVVRLVVSSHGPPEDPSVVVELRDSLALTRAEQHEVVASVARMIRADEDLSEFYRLCRERGGRWLRLARGMGRLMRSPTLFEDVVRVILTTNIAWQGTVRMVGGLVETLGAAAGGCHAHRAFPTPHAIATAPPGTLAGKVRLGYRGPYVQALARRVASGELDLEALQEPGIPSHELRKRLLTIKGVGPYAASTVSMLLGHYDELAVDSEFRQFVSRKYFNGRPVPDAEATAVYDEWGRWKYLAYWFDLLDGSGAPVIRR